MNSTKNENMEMEEEKAANSEPVHEEQSAEQTINEETAETPLDEKKLQQELEEAQAKIAEMQDRYLRLSAEFDNYRKRTLKEKAEIIRNGGEKTITAILPILDDMERALANMENPEDTQTLKEGVKLINTKFHKVLSQEGLSKILPEEGADFNTDYHEAIAMVPAPSEDLKGKILDCVQAGYLLNDKVIRHAKVAVAQ